MPLYTRYATKWKVKLRRTDSEGWRQMLEDDKLPCYVSGYA